MSEYMRPVKLPKTLDDLDHTGTLFEALPAVADLPAESSFAPVQEEAPRREPLSEHHRRPTTIEQYRDRLARRMAQQAIDDAFDRPYHDLGGHAPGTLEEAAENPFESLLERCEPWMRDVRLVVDRYGAAELTVTEIAKMTKADKKTLALHFDGFMTRLKAAHRLIGAADGDVTAYPVLERRYGKRSSEEMIAYLPILEDLHGILQRSGIAPELHKIAYDVSPSADKREAMRHRDDNTHGYPQIYFDGTKPRIERLPRREDGYRPVA